MPRTPRYFLPGIPLHVIQRGNNKQACFFAERDFVIYLDKLNEYSRKFSVAIHSYVLMTNQASPVDSDAYFLAVSRYVELNPVRACMVPLSGFGMQRTGSAACVPGLVRPRPTRYHYR